MTKNEIRRIYLARQRSLGERERDGKSLKIANLFFENFSLEKFCFLHIFLSMEKHREIKTNPIIKRLWMDFPEITTVVSRVDFETMSLEVLKYKHGTRLIKNKWEILEPRNAEIVDIKKIDVVLVPLLAFDQRGFRVGYGKGFYDRFLSDCRKDVLKIGLSYFAPVMEISDINEFDIRLDFCISPDNIRKF